MTAWREITDGARFAPVEVRRRNDASVPGTGVALLNNAKEIQLYIHKFMDRHYNWWALRDLNRPTFRRNAVTPAPCNQ